MESSSLTQPFGLLHDEWGRLVLIDGSGERHVGVVPVRLFPMSEPRKWVAICDRRGRELRCVEDLQQLPAAVRTTLEEELARREFIPILRRVQQVSSNTEPSEWQVETDRGNTRFILKSEDDIRRLGNRGVLIIDAHGIRYLIPDEEALDAYSKRVIEWYV